MFFDDPQQFLIIPGPAEAAVFVEVHEGFRLVAVVVDGFHPAGFDAVPCGGIALGETDVMVKGLLRNVFGSSGEVLGIDHLS